MTDKKYVPNDVFKFRISLNWDLDDEEITVYTKPFPEHSYAEFKSDEQWQKMYDDEEDLVQERYFTQEKIDELKQIFIKKIQESKNPFNISCVDRDGGYNVTEEELFDIERTE